MGFSIYKNAFFQHHYLKTNIYIESLVDLDGIVLIIMEHFSIAADFNSSSFVAFFASFVYIVVMKAKNKDTLLQLHSLQTLVADDMHYSQTVKMAATEVCYRTCSYHLGDTESHFYQIELAQELLVLLFVHSILEVFVHSILDNAPFVHKRMSETLDMLVALCMAPLCMAPLLCLGNNCGYCSCFVLTEGIG